MKLSNEDPEELKALKNQLTSQLEGDDVAEKLFDMIKTYCHDISFIPQFSNEPILNLEYFNPFIKKGVATTFHYQLVLSAAKRLFEQEDKLVMQEKFFEKVCEHLKDLKLQIFKNDDPPNNLMPFLHILL